MKLDKKPEGLKKSDLEIKKSDLETDITYFLCPDESCDIFWDVNRDCEYDCPSQEKLIKIIACVGCYEMIELPGDHSSVRRVDHKCSGQYGVTSNFQRMSGKYQIIYEKPK